MSRIWDVLDGIAPEVFDHPVRPFVATLVSFDRMLKDRYVMPGDRLKQYIVDERREAEWAFRTCPTVDVMSHDGDDTDDDGDRLPCASVGLERWNILESLGCDTCRAVAWATRKRDDVLRWRSERCARPPICDDRDQLSNEVEPPRPPLRSWLTDMPRR